MSRGHQLLLAGLALVACYLPARLDAAMALRQE